MGEARTSNLAGGRLPLYGPLELKDYKTFLQTSKDRFNRSNEEADLYKVNVEDYDLLKLLGRGAFGKVLLVRDKKEQTFYAMKTMRKRHIVKMGQVHHVQNEKRILQGVDFPFCVRMEYYAKDNSYIYFFMPFIAGGEMFTHLQKRGKFPEKTSKFFAAQVILGLEYLHNMNLVYRDLKPENLLVDHFGYLKITDFGFTKMVFSRTYTFCGTPQYLAPEIIVGYGYGRSVDWWSLGVLIYEMSNGFPPYNANDQLVMFQLILQNRYIKPAHFSRELKDLVDKLLQVDVTMRYGNLRGGARDVKNHEWFREIDWSQVLNRKVESPLIPAVTGQGDTTHFPTGTDASFLKVSDINEFQNEFKDF